MCVSDAERSLRRLIIIDDHSLFRLGLATMLAGELGIVVCAQAESAHQSLELIAAEKPDMVTLEISLGGYDGLRLIKEIHVTFPNLPVLVISTHSESSYAERCLRAGARGYVSKQQVDGTVLLAIRQVLRGDYYISPAINAMFSRSYLNSLSGGRRHLLDGLSDRQIEVFRLIGGGMSTRQIAESLHISIKTVESHRENIKCKLTLHSGVELARAAVTWVTTGSIPNMVGSIGESLT